MSTTTQVSSSSSASVSISVGASAASDAQLHSATVPTFHPDTMSSAAQTDGTDSVMMTTAVATQAKLMTTGVGTRDNLWIASGTVTSESTSSSHSPDKPLLLGSPADMASAAVSAAVDNVAGAANASAGREVGAEASSSPRRESDAPREREFCGCLEGWMPACIVDFFEFLCKIFCCCFSSDSPEEGPVEGSSGAAGEQGIELRVINPGSQAGQADAQPNVGQVDQVNLQPVPAALKSDIETQLEFAINAEHEAMNALPETGFPLKKVVVFSAPGISQHFAVEWVYKTKTDEDVPTYGNDLRKKFMPSKEDLAKVTSFEIAFVTCKEDKNDKSKVIADFNIYSYKARNSDRPASEKPEHEYHPCSSAEGFDEIVTNHHAELFEDYCDAEDDYGIMTAKEKENARANGESDKAEADAVTA